jgi:hypothetical protein
MVVRMAWTAKRFTQADWPERPLTARATAPCRPTRRQPVCGSIAEGDHTSADYSIRVNLPGPYSCRRVPVGGWWQCSIWHAAAVA